MEVVENTFEVERVKKSKVTETDFGNLQFGRVFSDHMFIAEYADGKWGKAKIQPYQNLSISPASCVFHYGQAIFEGLKAYRSTKGEIVLFRPDQNHLRLNKSALRMCMPEVPKHFFIEGLKQLIDIDRNWIPEGDDLSLYIRPFLIADEAFLGVKPSSRYKFMIITSPTSTYYTGAVKVKVENHYSRACQGGIGAAKAAANYAASIFPATQAQKQGYHQLIWTDANEHKYIEECGTMNIMFVINGNLITPSIERDTILPGITRASILQLAKKWNMNIEERRISVDEVLAAIKNNSLEEAFGVGTAATIAPFSNIGIGENDYELSDFNTWKFSNKAKDYLDQVKRGTQEDEFNWTIKF
ncbi:MAG: branched-chain amino acid aminotransferase [Bacteroidetes bacterium]|nr:MAG: branched-chain amino acid aminotransferase [Bacteroidota bacterium]MBL1144523.1 branched-chain amino acid aminotransferase [Bacteroidota bacterium]MCB0803293.1 branched-chain amino acid aminotransferase [Flavobacteriales bacterium]NOG57318.1 branched-chain amino acid aminotransferase [Bacteroidota bacterium]